MATADAAARRVATTGVVAAAVTVAATEELPLRTLRATLMAAVPLLSLRPAKVARARDAGEVATVVVAVVTAVVTVVATVAATAVAMAVTKATATSSLAPVVVDARAVAVAAVAAAPSDAEQQQLVGDGVMELHAAPVCCSSKR